jgi:hypothetical protein
LIGASGLSDDDEGKNDGLKWKLAESVHWQDNVFAASPLCHFKKFKSRQKDSDLYGEWIWMRKAQKVTGTLKNFETQEKEVIINSFCSVK